ncbi:hypothetical protein CANTEDRAFT_113474 [Yamadazyma tenuis ATCC 10573]|uniref:Uncharacterized protein n=1 Tax=Candida tenuis (strain ATCC 10573 / BCRC 21748 / CBS 615 / JCM 9827 / NBRC 10315 / NRRL Y-1498 / VKM Y-70) TaxID=590646 RepID=G3B2I4_CANTC|nr:uncharacterized protein CANTEDRAFT_113474 [Yamadazyma tenuis ATCC 10573]EGV64682.1 hypothetical protein CANTEDRAFT_113474 [Yamadazyma tenuis ATCC 10573]
MAQASASNSSLVHGPHGSTLTLNQSDAVTPHSPYNQSPLLLSNTNSRNNSISTTFDINFINSNNNSSSNSRRSSIAPDFFPNPLKDINPSHKRNVSNNSGKAANQNVPPPLSLNQPSHPQFAVPQLIGNSPTQSAFTLSKSQSNLSNVLSASNLHHQLGANVSSGSHPKKNTNNGSNNGAGNGKISVSSLID